MFPVFFQKYACECGYKAVVRKYSMELGYPISEATVKNYIIIYSYLEMLQYIHVLIMSLAYPIACCLSDLGRILLIGKLDDDECIKDVHYCGSIYD